MSKNLGRIAYEAYVKKAGGKSLANGQPLPAWSKLPPEITDAWDAAAAAVRLPIDQDLTYMKPLTRPLKPWELRDLVDEDARLTVVIPIDIDDILNGITAVNDIASERIYGTEGYALMDLAYAVVGSHDENTVLMKVTADASEVLMNQQKLTSECQNCGRRFAEEELIVPIPDLYQRVTPGEPMPSGECPVCSALCHPIQNIA